MVAILTSIHGDEYGLTAGGHTAGRGYKGPIVGYANGTEFVTAPGPQDKATMYDDFCGKTISTLWGVQKGSDGATVNFAINAALGGTIRATTGAGAGASYAANGVQLDSALNWEADKGGLVMEARLKISAITNVALYVGFTDQVASLIMPMTLSGGSLTTNASNGAGFLFDTAATVANFKICGVATDVDATFQTLTGSAPVAATYMTLRTVITSLGLANFYKDGVYMNSSGVPMTGAVTKTIPLTPVVAAFTRSAASITVDVDYIWVQQTR